MVAMIADRGGRDPSWPAGGGMMGALIQAHDWSATPLGPAERWPQSLKTAVGIMLSTRHPVFVFWGPELICLYNDAYAASLGPEKHPSILGMPASAAWPEALPIIGPELGQVMAGGEATWQENRLVPINRHGRMEEVYWTYSFAPIHDAEAPNGVGGVLALVTETTQAVVAQRESEARYRTLFESMDEGFCIVEIIFDEERRPVDLRYVETNSIFEQQTGIRGALGRTVRELVPDLEPFWFEVYGKVALTGEPTRFVDRARSMGRWFDVYAFRIGNPSDRHVAVLFKDVTERKRAEERLRGAFEIKTVGVMFWGEGFGLTDMNEAFLEMSGFTREEALGKTWQELTPEEFHPASLKAVEEVRTLGETTPYEKQYYRKDGSRWWGLFAARRIGEEVVEFVLDVTERRQAEAALRESEARLRALLEASSYSIYRMSPDWSEMRQLDGQGFLQDMQGPSGSWLGNYLHPDDQPHVMEKIREAVRTRSIFEMEHRVRRADGTLGWTLSRAVPILAPDGEIAEWVGAASDVTARRQAEEALRESEARFRLMADAVPQIVWITDPDGRAEFFNKQWFDYTGTTRKPRDASDAAANFIHPDDVPATLTAFDEARRSGGTFLVEHRIRSAAGQYRWFLVRAEPYRDPRTGEIVRWFGASIDIHDRKQAESALRESENRFRTLAETMPQLVWTALDTEGCTWASRRWVEYAGRPVEAMLGQGWLSVVHPEDRDRVERTWLASPGSGCFRSEFRMRRADGAWRWFQVMALPVPGTGAGPQEWCGACADITELKEAEAVLRAAHDEAERARAAAEEANRAKSRFLAAASHDLRQPVMAAGLYMGLLENRVREQEARGLVDMVSLSLEGLRGMLNGLLEMARLEAGIVEPKVEAFALDDLLQRLCAEFTGPARAARLRLQVPRTDLVVRSDRLLLELILRNLISNAIKYTERGGVALECAGEEASVRIDVVDTGPGIPPDQIQRVFEDFVQVGEENRSLGFGIGLATVRRAAELLEHRVEVRSEPGRGSTFSVWLPRSGESIPADIEADPKDEMPLPPCAALVVEDQYIVATALCMALEEWGLDVTVAHSVAQARAALAGRRFDVIVSDYQLPDGNGFDAISAARAGGTGAAVLLTGDTQPETLRRTHEAGLRLLTKPVDVRQLREVVRELTDPVPGPVDRRPPKAI
jgi:PAS domain S-box-containing protein